MAVPTSMNNVAKESANSIKMPSALMFLVFLECYYGWKKANYAIPDMKFQNVNPSVFSEANQSVLRYF